MPPINVIAFIHMRYDFMNSLPSECRPSCTVDHSLSFVFSLSLFLSLSDDLFGSLTFARRSPSRSFFHRRARMRTN